LSRVAKRGQQAGSTSTTTGQLSSSSNNNNNNNNNNQHQPTSTNINHRHHASNTHPHPRHRPVTHARTSLPPTPTHPLRPLSTTHHHHQVTGIIDLVKCHLYDPVGEFPRVGDCTFRVIDPSSREFIFTAATPQEKNRWLWDLADVKVMASGLDELGDEDPSRLGFAHTFVEGSLFQAVVDGDAAAASHLLQQKGCYPNAQDDTGRNAVHYAVELGHTEVLKAMLLGPGKNVDLSESDATGRRPFDVAVDMLSVSMVDVFFKAGFSVGRDVLVRALRAFSTLRDVTDAHVDFLETLFVRAGRKHTLQNVPNEGTLMHCVATMRGPNVREMISFLVRRGLDPNMPREGDGDSPLHVAG
jgi:ankyrin repeat protein